jgi:hypothetical protein
MNVHVLMGLAVVVVFVSVDTGFKGFADAPYADTNQGQADEAFGPGKDGGRQNNVLQKAKGQADENNSSGVPKTPAKPHEPGAAFPSE